MESSKEKVLTLGDVLNNVRSFITYLFKKWYVLLFASLLGGGIGLFFYYNQKPSYEAECNFILEEKQSGLGGLGGLASQFGVDIGGLTGGGGMFTGDNILKILSSKVILQQVLLSKIDSTRSQQSLVDLYLDFSGLKQKWEKYPQLSSISFTSIQKRQDLSIPQDSVLNIVYNKIIEENLAIDRASKKGTIISVQVISKNPEFSKLLVTRLVLESRKFYMDVKTSVTTSNVKRLERKADSLLALLTRKTYGVAQVQVNDPNPALKILQVPTEIATRDKTVLATLYTEVVKNLEIAKTTQMMQTPVIEIVDMPSLSIYDNKKGKLFFIVIGVFVFVTLSSVVMFFKFIND